MMTSSRKPAKKSKFPQGPIRTCVLCRTKAPKHHLQRLAVVDGIVSPGNQGRGAYVCAEHDAAQLTKYKKKLAKALRCDARAVQFHLKGEIRS